ncbi:hypothetical protein IW152_002694 [Coemansia sp. BCRC 34962]|nr:hypothetical protein IW152_002694 [Coemansia sp. BCRC 34962]
MSRLPSDNSELPPLPPQQQHLPPTGRQQPLRRGTRPSGQQPLLNVHSRAAAREQLRLQHHQQQPHVPTGGGILSDLDSLHSMRNRDTQAAFASTPLDSMTGSAYVSGHLTPTESQKLHHTLTDLWLSMAELELVDQWVAVRNEGSGVISLTSSDNEDEYGDSAMAIPAAKIADTERELSLVARLPPHSSNHQRDDSTTGFQIPLEARSRESNLPGEPPYYAPLPSARHWSAAAEEQDVSLEAEQVVHLLRESVVSLLSSGGSTTSSASSAQPGGGGSIGNSRRRYGSLQQQGAHRVSRSPSRLSKVSEPSYPPSAPRRQLTADFDHFSDIALTSTATPPHHYNHQHRQSTNSAAHRPPTTTQQLPTYEEFKQRQQQQVVPTVTAIPQSTQPAPVLRTNEFPPSTASAPAQPATRFQSHHHPLLEGTQHQPYSEPMSETMSRAAYSPFASIRTVSPILITEESVANAGVLSPSVSRAQAEAALQQAILCPLKSSRYSSGYVGHGTNAEKARNGVTGSNGNSCSSQTWAKYTGYAIVGFGVGTLVGMLCFDMAATAAPKATRTIPIAAGF